MPEREEGAELSEETRRLIDDLGRRLSEEAQQPELDTLASTLSAVDSIAEPQGAPEEKLGDLDAEISRAEEELRRLQEMREYLQRQLGGAREQVQMRRARMARLPLPDLPEYLEPLRAVIARRSPASFWLHGDDARERSRAVAALTDLLAMDTRAGWVVAEVDFTNGRGSKPTSASTIALDIAHMVRDAWDSWGQGRRPYGLRASMKPLHARLRMASALAVILSEFPSRRRQASPFLAWLRDGLHLGVPLLLVISTDRPPSATEDFEGVACESNASRFGRRLSTLRLQKGLTRREIARRTRLPQSQLSALEGGLEEDVSNEILRRLAGALGVEVDELGRG